MLTKLSGSILRVYTVLVAAGDPAEGGEGEGGEGERGGLGDGERGMDLEALEIHGGHKGGSGAGGEEVIVGHYREGIDNERVRQVVVGKRRWRGEIERLAV